MQIGYLKVHSVELLLHFLEGGSLHIANMRWLTPPPYMAVSAANVACPLSRYP